MDDDNSTAKVCKAAFKVEPPKSGLRHCLQLNLYKPRQGSTLERFDLSLDLSCGLHPLPKGLSIAARQCRVFMSLEACTFERGTSYTHYLQQGRVELSHSTEGSRERSYNVGAKGEAEGKLLGIIPTGSVKVQGNAGGDLQGRSKSGDTGKTTPAIPLISFEAGNTWVVGNEQGGDCRKAGGLLRDTYFNEEKDGDDPKPACWLRADSGAEAVRVRVGVAVRPGDLLVIEDNDPESAKPARRVGDDMVERLAGMAILKQVRRAGKVDGQQMEAELPAEHVLIAFGAIDGVVGDRDE